ncbi:MAG TPA: hypothetical protein VFF69_10770 [Phycisphaerales bacterium]|nr:hypothetical protein [Phycisphaerales bacterium]
MARHFVWHVYAAAAVAAIGVGRPAFAQFYGKKKDAPAEKPRELEKLREEGARVLAPLEGEAGAAASSSHWSIVLATFWGEKHEEAGRLGLHKVRAEAGLPGAYLETRDKATVIAYGRYESPSDPAAQADLARIRAVRVDGGAPFAAALLTPPAPEHLAGSLPELDLRNAKKQFGEDKALYTLQVAIYGRGDRSAATAEEVAEFRKAAEDAAVLLRRDGELAFYYHAPERSMVTVGIFGQEEYDPLNRPGIEGFGLIEARERHPLNLLNGKGIREKLPGVDESDPRAWRMQPSMLVGVPES